MNQENNNVELMEEIGHIRVGVSNLHTKLTERGNPTESAELGKLFEALAKAQLEMDVASTDCKNTFFKSKYADLASVVKASRPFLAKNGLAVMQRIIPNENEKMYLLTRLCHASGQWMESRIPILPPKPDIQTLGSYITYLRRYTYASMCGVVAADEDDDGEKAMEGPRSQGTASYKSKETVSKAQLEILAQELEGMDDLLETLFKGYGISKLSDLPSKHYTQCITRIRDIRRAKDA